MALTVARAALGAADLLYLFEDYVLDTDRHELRLGARAVPVEPQVFDVLTYLIQNRERVVTRDDLLAAVWEGRIVSESTLSSRINAARVALGDSGEDQRLIRTVLRRGFRFVGSVREEQKLDTLTGVPIPPPPDSAAALVSDGIPATLQAEDLGTRLVPVETGPDDRPIAGRDGKDERGSVIYRPEAPRRTHITGYIGGGIAFAAATVLLAFLFWRPGDTPKTTLPTSPAQMFDPTIVPLVADANRRSLASYPSRPNPKALAIAYDTTAVSDGATDIESAKQEALRQCQSKTKRVCRIYAAGLDVVWSRASVPLPEPGDLRSEPLSIQLVPDDVPLMRGIARRNIAEQYMKWNPHTALAITTDGSHYTSERRSRSEAARMAVEGCAEMWQRPCLVLSVDGFLTIQIPKTRKIDRIFLPSIETDIPTPHRERIAEIYRRAEWRAVAAGKNGAWEAVAGAMSETEAIEAALEACSRVDGECQLYAIGNFHVVRE